MSNKWRVTCGGHVLGHYAAKTPEESVAKAIKRSVDYHPEVMDKNTIFLTQRAGSTVNVEYKVIPANQEVVL